MRRVILGTRKRIENLEKIENLGIKEIGPRWCTGKTP